MARPKKEYTQEAVHARAVREFNRVQSALRPEREQSLQDRRFNAIAGAQWEGSFGDGAGDLGEQYKAKPRPEANMIFGAVKRIVNEARQNRITVNFVAKDGEETDEAEMLNSLYRADEQDSCADEAYDNALEEAAAGGYGAWRLTNEYEDEEDEDNDYQRIRIKPIYEADSSVFFDLDAKRQDKADAKRAWVVYSQSPDDFMEEWGEDPSTWPKDIETTYFDWATPDVVYVAEYYEKQQVSVMLRVFRTLDDEEVKLYDPEQEEIDAILAIGGYEVRSKKVRKTKVRKYILSGGGILEDCGFIAGKNIPIIPVYGQRCFVDNVERSMGEVRMAKDLQRLSNMTLSWLAQTVGRTPTRKPIFTPEQMAGLEMYWEDDVIKDYPFLMVNAIEAADGSKVPSGPLGYNEPPDVPAPIAAMLQVANTGLKEMLGLDRNDDRMVSNISAKAVEMIQQRVDMRAYIYLSNLAKAMRRCGEVWLSMAKDIYTDYGRKMKTVGLQGETDSVVMGEPMIKDGKLSRSLDLADIDFDVVADVGPSFTSQREALVRAFSNLLATTDNPEDRTILQALIMRNLEGEGLQNVNEFYRKKLVAMGVEKPTEQEAQEMAEAAQNQQPNPQDAYLMAEREKAMAEAARAAADTDLKVAQTAKTEAEAVKIAMETGNVGI